MDNNELLSQVASLINAQTDSDSPSVGRCGHKGPQRPRYRADWHGLEVNLAGACDSYR